MICLPFEHDGGSECSNCKYCQELTKRNSAVFLYNYFTMKFGRAHDRT